MACGPPLWVLLTLPSAIERVLPHRPRPSENGFPPWSGWGSSLAPGRVQGMLVNQGRPSPAASSSCTSSSVRPSALQPLPFCSRVSLQKELPAASRFYFIGSSCLIFYLGSLFL